MNTKLIEAAKQALEALELEDMACRYEKEPTPEHIAKAITALRAALEQPADEPSGPLVEGWAITFGEGHAGYGVYAHMEEYPEEGAFLLLSVEQPAQDEPVAWTTGFHNGYCVIRAADPAAILPIGIALYTRPQPVPTSDTSQDRVDETAKQRHEQPAQDEPVAWMLEWSFNGEERGYRLYDDETHCVFDAESDGGVCRPLYTRPQQPAQDKPVELETVYETIIQWDEGGGKRSRRELARRIVALYTSPQPVSNTDELPAQQEPVAWKDKTYGNLHHQDFGNSIPLYTRPQARDPLTDDQIADMRANRHWLTAKDKAPYLAGIRDAEIAHGITSGAATLGEKK